MRKNILKAFFISTFIMIANPAFSVDVSQISGANSASVLADDLNSSNTTSAYSTQSTTSSSAQTPVQNSATQSATSVQSNLPAVFGAHLFGGNFKDSSKHFYNPDYKIAVGDQISLKIWGAVSFEANLNVDSQGNIFIPQVGAVRVLGVRNADLLRVIKGSVSKVYKNNVFVYADMNAYQYVSVFVTGNVNAPGLYQGLSSDSIIQYIDKAGGINLDYGSFRDIEILRDNKNIANIDLYAFLLQGKMNLFAFRSGDVIFVGNVQKYAFANGDVQKPFRFELKDDIKSLADLARVAGAKPIVTNAVVKSYDENHKLNVNSYFKKDFASTLLKTGDEVEFRPDYNAQSISVRIEGEHLGLHSLVVKKGTNLAEVVNQIPPSAQSDLNAVQVFRKSVAKTQKQLIEAQLKELETIALTAPAVNSDAAAVRATQARNILEFIDRAKKVEPRGQIVIDNVNSYKNIILEEGDVLVVPSKNNLVLVQGEVSLPGAFVYEEGKKLKYYINLAGDYSDRADTSRILVINSNGKAEKYGSFRAGGAKISGGDSILILPKVETQSLQVTGMIAQILYQIAIATNVVMNW